MFGPTREAEAKSLGQVDRWWFAKYHVIGGSSDNVPWWRVGMTFHTQKFCEKPLKILDYPNKKKHQNWHRISFCDARKKNWGCESWDLPKSPWVFQHIRGEAQTWRISQWLSKYRIRITPIEWSREVPAIRQLSGSQHDPSRGRVFSITMTYEVPRHPFNPSWEPKSSLRRFGILETKGSISGNSQVRCGLFEVTPESANAPPPVASGKGESTLQTPTVECPKIACECTQAPDSTCSFIEPSTWVTP